MGKFNLENFDNLKPFSLTKKEKKDFFQDRIKKLTLFHLKNSKDYNKFLKKFKFNPRHLSSIDQIPFLPVRIFKEMDLMSIKKKDVFKVMLSSGTTGISLSKIYLDKTNAMNQIIVLNKIMKTILGNERLPMLIIDKNPKLIARESYSARVAAINGFSIFGKDHTYIVNSEDKINYEVLEKFFLKHKNNKLFIFGFTSLIFENLINNSFLRKKLDFSKAILLHGGGWKKMEEKKINNLAFKKKLKEYFNLDKIFNYYGLIEQTGSIFLECEKCSCFVTSTFSDVVVRDLNFNECKKGERGFIQLFSILPTSYPGHNILTEDIGEIIDNSNCICSKQGKAFLVYGRMPTSEVRGCSDTI